MSTHLIFSPAGFDAAAARAEPADQFILLGDGVYTRKTLSTDNPAMVFVLEEDLEIRGIDALSSWQAIDYDRFVKLCAACAPIVSWND